LLTLMPSTVASDWLLRLPEKRRVAVLAGPAPVNTPAF
jgi:hypothetical protein